MSDGELSENNKLKPPSSKKTISDFEFSHVLGKGAFGIVYLAKDIDLDMIFALKLYNIPKIYKCGMQKQIIREVEIMNKISHPYIVGMHSFFAEEDWICLVIEYGLNGDLFAEINRKGRLPETQSSTYLFQLAKAVSYLHSLDVIHRDIKPENIMLGFWKEVKLADFGWSVYSPNVMRDTFCGTPDYVPPEILDGNKYSKQVDLWSMGVLFFEMLTGEPPFSEEEKSKKFAQIKTGYYEIPGDVPYGARNIIRRLLRVQKEIRLKIEDILEDKYIQSKIDNKYMPNNV